MPPTYGFCFREYTGRDNHGELRVPPPDIDYEMPVNGLTATPAYTDSEFTDSAARYDFWRTLSSIPLEFGKAAQRVCKQYDHCVDLHDLEVPHPWDVAAIKCHLDVSQTPVTQPSLTSSRRATLTPPSRRP